MCNRDINLQELLRPVKDLKITKTRKHSTKVIVKASKSVTAISNFLPTTLDPPPTRYLVFPSTLVHKIFRGLLSTEATLPTNLTAPPLTRPPSLLGRLKLGPLIRADLTTELIFGTIRDNPHPLTPLSFTNVTHLVRTPSPPLVN